MQDDQAKTNAPQFLSGWKDIASYLGKGVRTVQRYERLLGLPVRRPAGKPWGSVVATKVEIDAWVAASPVREGLQLMRPAAGNSAAAAWADIQTGAAEMRKLAKQMSELRMELRSSVRLLRQSIRDVQGGLNRGESERSMEERGAQTERVFNLLTLDMGVGRKIS